MMMVTATLGLQLINASPASSSNADVWSAVATFLAVVVALAFGLRELFESRRQRLAAQRLAIASIASPIAEASAAVARAIGPVSKALEDGADGAVVLHGWNKMVAATESISIALKATSDVRVDLPPRAAHAISFVHGISAAIRNVVDGIDPLTTLRQESKQYADLRNMLKNIQPMLRSIDEDLDTAILECKPIIAKIREDLQAAARSRKAD